MIKNTKILRKFERSLLEEGSDRKQNFKIMNAMYKEAVHLGTFPLKDPLEGIEVDLKIAKVVNSV